MDLSRYIQAQNDPEAGYVVALHEIRTTGKRSHWMWYVFPQIEGLGKSPSTRYFALSDLEEAMAYMHHPVLGARLLEVSEAIVERLNDGTDLVTLMNSRIDVQKLVSCMTLFAGLAKREGIQERLARAASVILETAEDEGVPACAFTADQLTKSPPTSC